MNLKKLELTLERIVEKGIPGVDCIVKQGYKTIFRHQAGYADREAGILMQGDELFYLYSASKVITCVAALQLLEEGKFLLSDPIAEYLPEFENMQIEEVRSDGRKRLVPAKNPIRVWNLFTMSAGLDYDLKGTGILNVISNTNGCAPTREIVRGIASQPLHYEPGTQWGYSLAHDVLGALVEAVSGEKFGDYLKKHIFDLLDMKRTGFTCTSETKKQMMAQYLYDAEAGKVKRTSLDNEYIFGTEYESGGAGLISCVDDYIKFAAALANGGIGETGERILSNRTVDLMRTHQFAGKTLKNSDWAPYVGCAGYGYGLGVRTLIDRAAAGSIGPIGEFGWGGAAGVYVMIDPESKISMFYAQHMLENMQEYVWPRLRNTLYSCLE